MTEWKDIPGFAGYEVSDCGEVRRKRKTGLRSKWRPWAVRANLKPQIRAGYRYFALSQHGARVHSRAGRLVLLAFRGAPPTPDHQAAHNSGVATDDRLANLRWATPEQNQADRWRHGTRAFGERAAHAKFSDEEAAAIRARAGESVRSLAHEHSVNRHTIRKILAGESYRDKSSEAAA